MFFPVSAYFEASRDFGSPAFSLIELANAGEQAREAADQELIRALDIAVVPAPRSAVRHLKGPPVRSLTAAGGRVRRAGDCVTLIPDPMQAGAFEVELPMGGFNYRTAADAQVEIKLGRFGPPVTELIPVAGSGEVEIASDADSTPWRAELRAERRTLVCHG